MADYDLNFQKIYEDFRPKIIRYLTRMVGESEAEDLTQEVFTKIGQALKAFRGESRLSTWIYQIATHVALDRIRQRSFARHGDEKGLPVEAIAESEKDKDIWTGEQTASTEQRVIRKEMSGCIREMIERLPENYRAVIVLSELGERKDSEIADILGLSLHTVKIRLHRARVKLKKELTTACLFYRDDRNELACDRKSQFVQIGEKISA
jgi:RNA polymerase sigma-70 factor (ECF subfamily)